MWFKYNQQHYDMNPAQIKLTLPLPASTESPGLVFGVASCNIVIITSIIVKLITITFNITIANIMERVISNLSWA